MHNNPEQRSFLYMPFMHSESKLIHAFALKLFQRLGNEINLSFEKKHKVIIDRFGRYPHRNAILGRVSTPEETEFLLEPNSSFKTSLFLMLTHPFFYAQLGVHHEISLFV